MGISSYKPRHRKGAGRNFNSRKHIDNMYNRAWESYRMRFLHHNPKCYVCGAVATIVDHLVPHKGDNALFKKLDNHIPLCKMHHDTVTTKYDRRYVVGHNVTPKVNWLQKERARNSQTFAVKVLASYE